MVLKSSAAALGVILSLPLCASAGAAGEQVVIGDIDDLSGVYADAAGQGAIEAANMAIADFGGTILGRKIVFLSADHQNKPDIGASKFREWADQNGLNMLIGGSNTGVSIAMAGYMMTVVVEHVQIDNRERPFIVYPYAVPSSALEGLIRRRAPWYIDGEPHKCGWRRLATSQLS